MFNTGIVGVSAKTVRRKSDNTEFVLYEIQDTEGRIWTTGRKQTAGEANRLIGQDVTIVGTVEQNGAYTNFRIESITQQTGAPSGEFIQPRGSVSAPLPEPRPLAIPTPAPISSPAPAPRGGGTDLDWNIWRQTAAKVSANISTTAQEFWTNIDDLLAYFATGQKPNHIPGANGASPPNKFIPEAAVAAAIANDPGRDAPYDDGIPF